MTFHRSDGLSGALSLEPLVIFAFLFTAAQQYSTADCCGPELALLESSLYLLQLLSDAPFLCPGKTLADGGTGPGPHSSPVARVEGRRQDD